MEKIKLEIAKSVKEITTDFFVIEEDIDIYIPENVTAIYEYAFSCKESVSLINVDIFYSGTISQWAAIKKGLMEVKVTEDWYGYYYHNGPRYETSYIYYSWFKNHEKANVTIHCLDGEIKPNNSEDRKKPLSRN